MEIYDKEENAMNFENIEKTMNTNNIKVLKVMIPIEFLNVSFLISLNDSLLRKNLMIEFYSETISPVFPLGGGDSINLWKIPGFDGLQYSPFLNFFYYENDVFIDIVRSLDNIRLLSIDNSVSKIVYRDVDRLYSGEGYRDIVELLQHVFESPIVTGWNEAHAGLDVDFYKTKIDEVTEMFKLRKVNLVKFGGIINSGVISFGINDSVQPGYSYECHSNNVYIGIVSFQFPERDRVRSWQKLDFAIRSIVHKMKMRTRRKDMLIWDKAYRSNVVLINGSNTAFPLCQGTIDGEFIPVSFNVNPRIKEFQEQVGLPTIGGDEPFHLWNWAVSSIPDNVEVLKISSINREFLGSERDDDLFSGAGEVTTENFDYRKWIKNRIARKEVPEFGHSLHELALLNIDTSEVWWKRYIDWYMSHNMVFIQRTDGGIIFDWPDKLEIFDQFIDGPLMRAKSLHITVQASLKKKSRDPSLLVNPLWNELIPWLIDEPLGHGTKLKAIIATAVNVIGVLRDELTVTSWGDGVMPDRDWIPIKGRKKIVKNVFKSFCPIEDIREDADTAASLGLNELSKWLRLIPYLDYNVETFQLITQIKLIEAISGHVGTESYGSSLSQVSTYVGAKSAATWVSDEYANFTYDIVKNVPREFHLDENRRRRLLFESGKSASASLREPPKVQGSVSSVAVRFDSNGKVNVDAKPQKISLRLSYKSEALRAPGPELFIPFDPDNTEPQNAGSRNVTNTKLSRSIAPHSLAKFITQLTVAKPLADWMNRTLRTDCMLRPNNYGLGKASANPAETLAHALFSTGHPRGFFICLAVDGSQWDSTQSFLIRMGFRRGMSAGVALWGSNVLKENMNENDFRTWSVERIARELFSKTKHTHQFFKSGNLIFSFAGLASGEFVTAIENTVWNEFAVSIVLDFLRRWPNIMNELKKDFSENEILEKFNLNSKVVNMPSIVLTPAYQNLLGDDSLTIVTMSTDAIDMNVTDEIMSAINYVYKRILGIQVSLKRQVFSPRCMEHLKIRVAGGVVVGNDQVSLFSSEKTINDKLNILEVLSGENDKLQLVASRGGDPSLCRQLILRNWPLFSSASGDGKFFPSSGVYNCSGQFGYSPTLGFLTNSITGLLTLNNKQLHLWDRTMRGLIKVLRGQDKWSDKIKSEVFKIIEPAFNRSVWKGSFPRSNNIDISKHRLPGPIKKVMPEYLFETTIKNLSDVRAKEYVERATRAAVIIRVTKESIPIEPINLAFRQMVIGDEFSPADTESTNGLANDHILRGHRVIGVTKTSAGFDILNSLNAIFRKHSQLMHIGQTPELVLNAYIQSRKLMSRKLFYELLDIPLAVSTELTPVLERAMILSSIVDQFDSTSSFYDHIIGSFDYSNSRRAEITDISNSSNLLASETSSIFFRNAIRLACLYGWNRKIILRESFILKDAQLNGLD